MSVVGKKEENKCEKHPSRVQSLRSRVCRRVYQLLNPQFFCRADFFVQSHIFICSAEETEQKKMEYLPKSLTDAFPGQYPARQAAGEGTSGGFQQAWLCSHGLGASR